MPFFPGMATLLGVLEPDGEGPMILWIISSHSPNDTHSHPRRLEYS